ncbi:CBS domain-containing protein [Aestuariivirga sp.]|uniref:CBS domain-containing protein n=1 Tax=Aestuariivirga sp. TaxID=2650926 RepID=UPI0035948C4C
MNQRPRIRDYMASKVVTLSPDMEILRAMELLLEMKFSGAPVVDESGRLVGVLSKKDCLKAALNASYHQQWGGNVADYMSMSVETLDANLDLVAAAEQFLASHYRRFPVMEDGRMIGQISRADLLRALVECWR